MNIGGFVGEDEWDDYPRQPRRRPSPHHARSGGLLDPHYGTSGLYRSRSQGHGVQPQINIYNRNQDEVRNASPYPPAPYPPYPTSTRRASPRQSPEGRGRSRIGERLTTEIEAELADMALEHRYGRSRSRARTDATAYERPPIAGYEWQIAQLEAERRERSRERSKERSRERAWRLEQERIKNKLKLEALQDEMKKDREEESAKEREKRLIAEYKAKQREADEKKEADEKRAVEEFERKQREAKEKREAEEKRIQLKLEQDARDAKEKREKEYREFKEQERKEKEDKERKYEEFLREQKEREDKKKKEKEEEEVKFQAEMRKRLSKMGYTEQTIEILVNEEKAKQFKKSVEKQENQIELFRQPRAPVYPKIHREYLDVETLTYYNLPWEYDRSNPDYIIILKDMDKRSTDLLFEHTTRLRSGRLLLEGPKKEKQFALYRRRSKSRGVAKEVGVLRLR